MIKRLSAKTRDLGNFSVNRILPHPEQRTVGPFIFFDHFGPVEFEPGSGINVRPHPHIGLATITYLFAGSIIHRDSLGFVQQIFPGDVNWMTAGKGIVHSERETVEVRSVVHQLEGIQSWIALPEDKTQVEPSFSHFKAGELPCVFRGAAILRIIAGRAYGRTSPVITYSPMLYIDAIVPPGTQLEHPNPEFEAAIFIQKGEVKIGEQVFRSGDFVLWAATSLPVQALRETRLLILGGEALRQTPILKWNFVAYSEDRIQEAQARWRNGQFPKIPGDNEEFIPSPD